jgi:exodeoxyribonuclease V alpha subunit
VPTTIHKLLGVVPGPDGGWEFSFNERNPLPFRFIIIDETSMLDTDLAASLLRACAPGTHVLLVGDANQLPPVGHGAPLRDLLDAGIPAARLTEIRRNSGAIVEACSRIREGDVHFGRKESLSDFTVTDNLIQLKARGEEKVMERVHQVYEWLAAQRKWDLIEDVQVLSARNKTRKKLNKELQKLLNPKGDGDHKVFRTGDKVINLRNNLFSDIYVANGDIGRVNSFRERQMIVGLTAPARHVVVPLGRVAEEDDDRGPEGDNDDQPNTGCSWDLAFCATCHKYQGSETPVVIVLAEPAGPLASREWLYTAISRARELCVIIGSDADIGRYVKTSILPARKTLLVEWLKEGLS